MIVSIWVFFMLGEPTLTEPGTPYVQIVSSPYMHDVRPDVVERDCAQEYAAKYGSHPVCDCGWRRQEVTVMGS